MPARTRALADARPAFDPARDSDQQRSAWVAAPHGHAAKNRRARDGYCSLSAPAPGPPAIAAVVATAIAAVIATAIDAVIATTAAVTTATAGIDLDNMAGRGRRRGGYHR